uniref:Uncharacterized protein n=1 Tax=Tanacetum cinerariifolium TaxID=118510 RepID=A0A6L2K4C5_TANCI|nr:hypothetical protein [Tanacetum cinerariifolium]
MVVQLQLGEGSAIPTDPQHTPTLLQSSSFQPQKTQKLRKSKRKDPQVPQLSGPTESIADEAVYKEMDDSLVRAATTASSLEAEQDSGNINKTQSKATPNESSSKGTDSGGGPRCQDTMRDTIAQTRSERVSKFSNDSLLARGNTLQSDEDRLKLNELMELCTTLKSRVLDLEKIKTTQALEIDSFKRTVKKLEKKQRSITYNLKRLYKVGDEQMFDVDQDLHSEEVLVAKQDKNVVKKEVDAAQVQVSTAATTATISIDEVTLAQALAELKHIKPKAKPKEIVFHEPEESTTTTTQIPKAKSQDNEKRKKFFAAKRANGKSNKPPTQAQQRSIMCTYLKNMKGWKHNSLKNKSFANIQELFDKAMKRVNTFVDFRNELVEESSKTAEAEVMEGSSKRASTKLEQESSKKIKIDDDKETAELKQLVKIIPDEEEVAIDVIPLAVTPSIVDRKIHKEQKKSYYKIIRADGSSKIYLVFSHMLKIFDKEDVETLWKLAKAKHESARLEEDYEKCYGVI